MISLLVSAMALLVIAIMVNNSIWTFLAAWIWVAAATLLVMIAWTLLDNFDSLKPQIVKDCLPAGCDAQHFNDYKIFYDRYRGHHANVVLWALGVALAASFVPVSGSIWIQIALLTIGPLIAAASWMIGRLRAILRCWK